MISTPFLHLAFPPKIIILVTNLSGMFRPILLALSCSLATLMFAQEIEHKHDQRFAFQENKGQWPKDVLFKAPFSGGNLWIQQRKLVFHLQDLSGLREIHEHAAEGKREPILKQTVIHLNFDGANEVNIIQKEQPSPTYYNYFIGNDSAHWASDVHAFQEAYLREFYDGIDLKLLEDKLHLKYEFHVRPGANIDQIRMNYAGHTKMQLDKRGNLVIDTELGQIIEQKPYAYQIIHGNMVEVPCSFVLTRNNLSFSIGKYDPSFQLIIDPVLVFATYSGSVSDNFGMTATYGYDGTAYSGGVVYGNSYPMPDNQAFDISSNFTVPINPTYGISDVFITKYNTDGTDMLWSTYLGGGNQDQGTETAHSLICDKQNNLYIYGATSSTDFPIINGYQPTHAGGTANSNFLYNGIYFTTQGTDIYVAKISSNGHNLLASTYIGGSANDGVNYMISSKIYDSVDDYDSLTMNYGDQFRGEIMLDSSGNCVVASCTRSTNFPLVNAFQTINGGMQDGVVFKLSSDLSSLLWSSYYGGSKNDACYSLKIDSSANIVFTGGTCSFNLPGTSGGWKPTYNGGKTDGFVVKIKSGSTSIFNASYIGTTNYDQSFFVEIDRNDNVFLLGQSAGGQFPVHNAVFVNPTSSQFVIKLDPTLKTNLNSTVFGNSSASINISPSAFLVDICGNLYISGWGANILQNTPLNGMPVTTNAFQQNPANGFDFYLLVIDKSFDGILYGSYLGGKDAQEHVDGGTSRFDKNGIVYQSVCAGCGGFSDFPTTPGVWSNNNLSTNCNNIVFKFDFQLIPNAQFKADQTLGCATFDVILENFSTNSYSYVWDFGNGDTSSIIFNPTVTYDTPGIYEIYLYVTDSVCLQTDTAKITITVLDSVRIDAGKDIELCAPVPIQLTANSFGTADYFVWSTSSDFSDTLNENLSDSILYITPPGSIKYYLRAGNKGCYQVDSVEVDFISSSVVLSGMDSLCLGQTAQLLATNSNPNFTFNYDWRPDSLIISGDNTELVTVKPTVSQHIGVTASALNGCIVKDSIFVAVGYLLPGAVVAKASEYNVPVGATVTLSGQPSGLVSYNWSPPTDVTNPTMQSTKSTIEANTLFTLTGFDGVCKLSDTVLVKAYTFICEEPHVFVPNAFSPNGDNENDILYVRGQMIEGLLFRVFNRWGEMVFESTDRMIGWDGTFRGKPMDPDVYDYYLKAICIDGEESIIKGNITLMR
jgi:gliding motility-associated-like protein